MGQVINQIQGLAQQYYTTTSQSDEDCFYVPQPTNSAPLFRGTCGTTNAVANFDINNVSFLKDSFSFLTSLLRTASTFLEPAAH